MKYFLICLLLAAYCLLLFPDNAEAGQWGRLAFQIVGTVIGSYFGPIGGMIGGAIGGMIGGLIFGEEGPKIRGPRLSDLTVQSAAHGAHVHRTWGTNRVNAQIIFSSDLKEHKHKTEVGGKGMGGTSQTSITYTYSVDIMFSFGEGVRGLRRLWFGPKLVYDQSGTADIKKKWRKIGKKLVIRDGNESQLPSALEESYHGAGNVSAHRGLFCIEFDDLDLTPWGNSVANLNVTAEVYSEGEEPFQKIASYTPPAAPYSYWRHSFGNIDPNGELWALYHPSSTPYWYPDFSSIFHWTLDRPSDPVTESHTLWEGDFIQQASIANTIRTRSDEPSAAVYGSNANGIGFSYFQLEAGTRIDVLQATIGGWSAPEILVKDGEEMFVIFAMGTPPGYLIKFDLNGTKLAESAIINSTLGAASVSDAGASESYLWVLYGARFLKIDRDTLALVADVTITGTTGNVLAMAVASDSELRLFTAAASGSRFYVVDPVTGVATLDKHATAEGYAAIRGFGKWGLRYVDGIYIVDFAGYIGGFAALIDFFADHVTTQDIKLWKIVRDINIMSGLDSVVDTVPPTVGDIAVGELMDDVHGYTLSRAMTAREALIQLQLCYFFDCREKDLKLDYPKRGKAPVRTLPGTDLAVRTSYSAALPDRLTHEIMRETESPLRVHVIYNNWEANYQSGHEYAPRLITDARATLTVEIAVAITSTKARQVADTLLALAWLEREKFTATVSRKHLRLDAADNIDAVITET